VPQSPVNGFSLCRVNSRPAVVFRLIQMTGVEAAKVTFSRTDRDPDTMASTNVTQFTQAQAKQKTLSDWLQDQDGRSVNCKLVVTAWPF
jgi:hypothetical protein